VVAAVTTVSSSAVLSRRLLIPLKTAVLDQVGCQEAYGTRSDESEDWESDMWILPSRAGNVIACLWQAVPGVARIAGAGPIGVPCKV
jgi:hypothetical protein